MLLLAFVLGLGFLLVRTASYAHARGQITSDLRAGAMVFERLVRVRLDQLALGASLMSDDWAFRRLYGGTEDFSDAAQRRTLLSGLNNYRMRMRDGAFIALVSGSGEWLADTRHGAGADLGDFPHPGLLEAAEESEALAASSFEWIDENPFIVLVVPILLPDPSGWIAIGFRVDDRLAHEYRKLTDLEISFVRESGNGGFEVAASTLPPEVRVGLADGPGVSPDGPGADEPFNVRADGEEWIAMWSELPGAGDRAFALLQRSLTAELAPYRELQRTLGVLTLGSLGLSGLIAVWLGRSISKPVDALALAAKRIQTGNYLEPVELRRSDEFGRLADAFNAMARGLHERDRVRDLLGKAVSPSVAAELLERPPALGGEERRVSVLFTDLRGFTRLSEGVSPGDLLGLLNAYFTCITREIESHGGVVDKYIGDSVMAVFGAPVTLPDHADRAVACGAALCRVLADFNARRVAGGAVSLATGIGIASGTVVAGNMGSESRNNYTVVGDPVNLASRLQALTKDLGCACLVDGATADLCSTEAGKLVPCGEVGVRGRSKPVRVFRVAGA